LAYPRLYFAIFDQHKEEDRSIGRVYKQGKVRINMVERITILTFDHNANIMEVVYILRDVYGLADIGVIRDKVQKVAGKLVRLLKYTG
jgi:hypothetical protein